MTTKALIHSNPQTQEFTEEMWQIGDVFLVGGALHLIVEGASEVMVVDINTGKNVKSNIERVHTWLNDHKAQYVDYMNTDYTTEVI